MRIILIGIGLLFCAANAYSQPPVLTSTDFLFMAPPGKRGVWQLSKRLGNPAAGVKWRFADPLPSWISFDSSQAILEMGNRSPAQFVTKLEAVNADGKATARLLVVVSKDAQWKTASVDLGTAFVGQRFEVNLNKFIQPLDFERVVRFKAERRPAWLSVDERTGLLSGTPTASDVGTLAPLALTVSSVSPFTADGLLKVSAAPTPVRGRPPQFLANPIDLPVASLGVDYQFDLSTQVKDPEGDPISYSIVFGPSWLKVGGTTGLLSGKPDKVGNFTAVIEVSDGVEINQGGVQGTVNHGNQAPILQHAALMFSMKEREVLKVDLNQPKYVTDDGSNLTFSFPDNPSWANVTAGGALTLSPNVAQVGDQALKLEVSDGTLVSTGQVRVKVYADARAPEWKVDPVKFAAKAGVTVNLDISDKAFDPDNRPLTFKKMTGPSWLDVTQKGQLFGKPPASASGDQAFVIRVSNGILSADGGVIISLAPGNQPPKWNAQAPALKPGRSGDRYQEDLNAYVTEPEGEKVTFFKVGGPAWVKVAEDGTVAGTPRPGDVGPNGVRLRATDESGASSEVTALIQIAKPNGSPKWISQTIELGQIPVGKSLALSLKNKVTDEEGDPITFSLVSGPGWVQVDSATGEVTGAPTTSDLGNFVVVFGASDGSKIAEAGGVGKVVPKNNPPVIDLAALVFSIEERKVLRTNLRTMGAVTDPDAGDSLNFSLGTVSWAELSASGDLVLRPTYQQIGTHKLTFDVSDGKDVVPGEILVSVTRNPRPPHWKTDSIQVNAMADVKLTQSIAQYAEDYDGISLVFSKKMGPNWLTVGIDGKITGTPTDAEAGENVFVVVAKNDKLEAETALVITVGSDNSKPLWNKNPVVLKTGKAGTIYRDSLKPFAVDPDPDDELTFKKLSGPAWAYVLTSGLVFGPPEEVDAGLQVLTVQVRDSRGATADAKVHFQIESKNNPPRWTQETIPLGNAKVGIDFAFDLTPLAEDVDGDLLSFRKAEGPAWMLVGTGGKVGGRPGPSDGGQFVAKFEVTDGKVYVPVDVFGEVLGGNKSPVINEQALTFSISPNQTFEIELDDEQYVADPEGDAMTFELLSRPPWAKVSVDGLLTLTPTSSNKGTHELDLRVTDIDGAIAQGKIKVTIQEGEVRPPQWLFNPWEMSVQVDVQFTKDLTEIVKDVQKFPIAFKKLSGPAWLSIRSDGLASGRPTNAQVAALQVFEVETSNGVQTSKGTLEISVAGSTFGKQDVFPLGVAQNNPPVEMLFLVDHNANTTNGYFRRMKDGAAAFFADLDRSGIRYSLAAASVRKFSPETARDSRGNWRVTSRDPNLAFEFGKLLDGTYSNDAFASAIWSINWLLVGGRSQPQLYRNDFYEPYVPLLVFVHSFQKDDFRVLQEDTIGKGASASRWSTSIATYAGKHYLKPLQIFVNDSSCNNAAFADYQELVSATKGIALHTNPCAPPFSSWMDGFAQKVIHSAHLYGNPKFRLGTPPAQPSDIKVTLRFPDGDIALTGNTGQESDKWHYDSRTQEVILHWWNIYTRFGSDPKHLIVDY